MTRVRSAGRRPETPRAEPSEIRFGTSGWRGVLGEEVTFPRLRRVVSASAHWLRRQPGAGRRSRVLVGYDARFASERMAVEAAAILRRAGLVPILSDRAVPTPVVTAQVAARRALGGIVLTASHNPPEYHGIKVFALDGSGIGDGAARRIEARAVANGSRGAAPIDGATSPPTADLVAPYLRRLREHIDVRALRRARPQVEYDAFHGVGAGVLDEALRGCGVRVTGLRLEADPRFGGITPDPTPERLGALRVRLRKGRGLRLGLATDGDADRLAAVDEAGRVLSETELVALLVDHLALRGRLQRGVAVTRATGTLVERVAESHGLPVLRTAMGFKNLAAVMRRGQADAAGDESGGFAWVALGLDKDGIAGGCLLTELLAIDRVPLGERLRDLQRRHGRRLCGRRAVGSERADPGTLARLVRRPPGRVDGQRVLAVDDAEGLHLELEDGFVMWRPSGTEPVVRVYAEAPSGAALERRLAAAERLWARRRAGS